MPCQYWKLFVLCCLPLQAQAQAELRSDSNHVETGNPFHLHLRLPATLGKPDSLNFEVWRNFLPPQNIVDQTAWQADGQFYIKKVTALFFDEDSIQLPPLPIALRNGDSVLTNALQFVVTATPSPDDLNDMAPIKDIHREPTHWTDYLPWILGGLGVLALVVLMYWWANRKSEAKILSRSIETPPHELAIKKLNALAQKQLIFNGFVKEHYVELTFILREYLEKRFEVPALESTTEETVGYLEGRDFPRKYSQELQHLLEQADLAKFAKIIPPESFHAEALETSRKIILQTSADPNRPITTPPVTTPPVTSPPITNK
ncbi:MAG: hypothetical protein Q7T20_18070 [Saprospiraceae bacterium]|nr:hypothetical protein [Saprospiraceae bacterium]